MGVRSPMNILWYGDSPGDRFYGCTGFGRVTRYITNGLVAAGHRVQIAAFNYFGGPVDSDVVKAERLFAVTTPPSVCTEAFGLSRLAGLVRAIPYNPVLSFKPDVFVVFNDPFLFSEELAEEIRKACDETDTRLVHYFPVDSDVDEDYLHLARRADVAITYHPYGVEQIALADRGLAQRVRTVGHGVDPEVFFLDATRREAMRQRLGCSPRTHLVVYIGDNQPRKGLPDLLQAFVQVARGAPDAHLFLRTNLKSRKNDGINLYRVVRHLGLSGRVASAEAGLDNSWSEADLVDLYRAADLVVQPSLAEGWGLVPCEAMACGTGVAVADNTVPARIHDPAVAWFLPVDRVGRITPHSQDFVRYPIDVRAAADVMLQALLDPDERLTRAAQGVEYARRWSWPKCVIDFMDAITEKTS